MDGWADGWMGGWMDEWMGGRAVLKSASVKNIFLFFIWCPKLA